MVWVDKFIYKAGVPVSSIHGDRTQQEREDALRRFKVGQMPIIVATAVAARGLDISINKNDIEAETSKESDHMPYMLCCKRAVLTANN